MHLAVSGLGKFRQGAATAMLEDTVWHLSGRMNVAGNAASLVLQFLLQFLLKADSFSRLVYQVPHCRMVNVMDNESSQVQSQ